MTPNINILLSLIDLKSIKIISFDIFDTLLTRSVLIPSDIFVFLDSFFKEIIDKNGVKISKIRIDCENELINEFGVENVTFDSIYKRIESKINLERELINEIKKKELEIEIDLVEINNEINNILLKAKENGKKVILTSDMYFTSEYIALFLNKFNIKYDGLYISADIKKRKDKGDLFDEIIYIENVLPAEILHIGDNRDSDFIIPLGKGIIAIHYVNYYIKERKKIYNENRININEITSVFLGNLLVKENNLASKDNMKFTNIYDFGYYCLAPMLLSMTLHILFSKEIQETYETLFFSSRDGYLPLRVYELLRNVTGKGIPGKYIYCGRRALNIAYYDNDVIDYISRQKKQMELFISKYPFEISELFSSMRIDKKFYKENNCDNNENIEDYINDLFSVSVIFNERKENTKEYFCKILKGIKKGVVFDCGYSGSVSDSIYCLTNERVNKIYMWEEEKNKDIDKKNNTKTHLLYHNFLAIKPFHLIFEELFSPAEATCIGYEKRNEEMQPIFDEDEVFSDIMKNDLTRVHEAVLDYVKKFCKHFNKYLLYFDCIDYQLIFDYTMKNLFIEKDESINLFSNILFPDEIGEGKYILSLTNKLIFKNRNNSCKGSILFNTSMLHINKYNKLPNNLYIKMGIHLHLFHIEQYIEFIEKLAEFPYPFDLFITYSDTTYDKILSICFSSEIIQNLNKLTLLITKNRGRDVGPWLIEMKKVHLEYDIFSHIHTKKNTNIDYGNKWRNYFLVNLIKKDSVIDIINLFYSNEKLGIVYPPMFKELYSIYRSAGEPPFQEINIINEYLKRIKIPAINNCNEIPFSVGTMFWYRPKALKKLFLDSLSYNDFPEEPIGINGTLAHAIERLPSYIAKIAGYDTQLYLNSEILSEAFYDSYKEQLLIDSYQSIKHEQNKLINDMNRIASERDILLKSRSWRFTKPMRDLATFIRQYRALRLFAKGLLSIKRNGIKKTIKRTLTFITEKS